MEAKKCTFSIFSASSFPGILTKHGVNATRIVGGGLCRAALSRLSKVWAHNPSNIRGRRFGWNVGKGIVSSFLAKLFVVQRGRVQAVTALLLLGFPILFPGGRMGGSRSVVLSLSRSAGVSSDSRRGRQGGQEDKPQKAWIASRGHRPSVREIRQGALYSQPHAQ